MKCTFFIDFICLWLSSFYLAKGAVNINFSNMPCDNCTFTVCFQTGEWLISQLLLFSTLVVKIDIFSFKTDGESMVQLSLDVLGKK